MAIWSATWSAGELIAYGPLRSIARWEQKNIIGNSESVAEASAALIRARSIDPLDADYDLALGRIALARAEYSSDEQTVNLYARDAVDFISAALAMRPSSGLAWTHLGRAYALLPGEASTARMIAAIEHGSLFSPYEEETQRHLIPLAISRWTQLAPDIQSRLMNIIQHALTYQPDRGRFALEAALVHDWIPNLEPYFNPDIHPKMLARVKAKMAQQK